MCHPLSELLWKLFQANFGGQKLNQLLSADLIQKRDQPHDSDPCRDRLFSCATSPSQDSHAEALPMAQQALRSTQWCASSQTVSSSAVTCCDMVAVQHL